MKELTELLDYLRTLSEREHRSYEFLYHNRTLNELEEMLAGETAYKNETGIKMVVALIFHKKMIPGRSAKSRPREPVYRKRRDDRDKRSAEKAKEKKPKTS